MKEGKQRVIIIRSNDCRSDSRVIKEANCLNDSYDVELLVWNREKSQRRNQQQIDCLGKMIMANQIHIKAEFGAGIKNIIPLVLFQIRELIFLISNRKKYDLYHACDFDTVLPAMICAKLFRKKIIYDIFDYYADDHSDSPLLYKSIKTVDNLCISLADATIICTDERKKQIKDANPTRLAIIHNSPPDESVNKKFFLSNKRIKVVYVGCLLDERFLKEQIEVISQLENVELHIGGIGPLDKYVKECSAKFDNIIYYGKMKYEDVLSLESEADILTAIYNPQILNNQYAAPNKFYEALMAGKPLVVIKNTGMDDYVSQYDMGKIIDYPNKDFSSEFKRAIMDISERIRLKQIDSDKIRKIYDEKFSWNIMKERLNKIYLEVISDE
ncbi:MAG: glycosyltransferase [Acetatifactor sp.]|nr:glycosyltransferase [Acetatifactor sp.]